MKTGVYPILKKLTPLLLVADLNRAISFYNHSLGFDVSFRYEDFYAGMVKDGCTIHLKLGNSFQKEREERRKNEDIDLVFSIDNIQQFYDTIDKTSVSIVQVLREMPYGMEFYIADPDGYIISFLSENDGSL